MIANCNESYRAGEIAVLYSLEIEKPVLYSLGIEKTVLYSLGIEKPVF